MKEFRNYHPIVNFIYFVAVIGFGMFLMHPAYLAVSILSAILCSIVLNGRRAALICVSAILPLVIVGAVLNPIYNHQGVTIISYLPDGNPLTLESVVYGIAAALMLGTVICWFSCYNSIMTSDKFLYLFGKIIPSLSLILSMTLRFVPKFREQLGKVISAQKGIGNDIRQGGFFSRIRKGVAVLSVMVSWMLESSVETAASMKCRGYGLKGRSAFSLFSFTRRDFYALIFIVAAIGYIICGYVFDATYFSYFPMLYFEDGNLFSISVPVVYFMLCMMPVYIEVKERVRWNALKSKI